MTDRKTDDAQPGNKKPGEKPAGKFHYNPGNMAGKTAQTTSKHVCPDADTRQPRVPGEDKSKP